MKQIRRYLLLAFAFSVSGDVWAALSDSIIWLGPPYRSSSIYTLDCQVSTGYVVCDSYYPSVATYYGQVYAGSVGDIQAIRIQDRNPQGSAPPDVCARIGKGFITVTGYETRCWDVDYSYSNGQSILVFTDLSGESDPDADVVIDGYDNCPAVANMMQENQDGDSQGDACDADDDNDGWTDTNETSCGTNSLSNLSVPADADGDLNCDAIDTDDDNDGVADTADKFPLDANRWQRIRHNTDFDNDSDILIRSASAGTWSRYSVQNNAVVGSGVINAPISSDSVYVAQLDANGDGDADILTRSASAGAWTLSVVENGAVTSSVPLYLYANLGYVFVGAGDFNNDGTDDVMLRHATQGYRVFLLQNHAVSSVVLYNAWVDASSVDQGIGDFNGDGTDDLLVRRTSDNLYFVFKTINGAVSNYYCACNIWANPDWIFQFAGDTNNDSIDDVIVRGTGASADGKWWAFRMNNFSSVLTTNLNLFLNKTAVTVGAVGDYNGDGSIDVLTRVNNSTTYVSPIVNGTVTGNYWLYNFTSDQMIGR